MHHVIALNVDRVPTQYTKSLETDNKYFESNYESNLRDVISDEPISVGKIPKPITMTTILKFRQ